MSPLPPEDQQHQAKERAKRAGESSSLPVPDGDSQQQTPVQTGSATTAAAAAQARRAPAADPNSKLGACLHMISEDPDAAPRRTNRPIDQENEGCREQPQQKTAECRPCP